MAKPPGHTKSLLLPLAFIAGLVTFLLVPRIAGHSVLSASFAGAAAVLAIWLAWIWRDARRRRRPLAIEISLRPQHYLQAVAHTMIFVYWGLYWAPIRDAAPLIAAQIVFAYAFDMLLTWSRKDTFVLGFGPFPIIYSTNLFLRFKDEWFYWQFAMVAVGFLAKELIRWHRDGRRVHVFNPSSFPLALFSLGLIVTGTTNITWGEAIASELFVPPNIYLFIFLVALPGQFLFGVSSMTLPAVLTTYLFSLAYLKATGTYLFVDSHVPIAVFLGMHLLFTDPSTSPRTELGRIIFGVIYGLSVVALFMILEGAGIPSFYDKLLQVPLMNLMVRALDRVSVSTALSWLDPRRLAPLATPRLRGFAYATLWVITFSGIVAANGVGDYHPGHGVPFWRDACGNDRPGACATLSMIEETYCGMGSAWACNELGILGASKRAATPATRDLFSAACTLGFRSGCRNRTAIDNDQTAAEQEDPSARDYTLLLQHGKGPLPDMPSLDLYALSCERRWMEGCARLGLAYLQETSPRDPAKAAVLFARACEGGHPYSCSNLGLMHNKGDGVAQDRTKAMAYLKQACNLGMANACRWLDEENGQK